jgi:hypothetical protein
VTNGLKGGMRLRTVGRSATTFFPGWTAIVCRPSVILKLAEGDKETEPASETPTASSNRGYFRRWSRLLLLMARRTRQLRKVLPWKSGQSSAVSCQPECAEGQGSKVEGEKLRGRGEERQSRKGVAPVGLLGIFGFLPAAKSADYRLRLSSSPARQPQLLQATRLRRFAAGNRRGRRTVTGSRANSLEGLRAASWPKLRSCNRATYLLRSTIAKQKDGSRRLPSLNPVPRILHPFASATRSLAIRNPHGTMALLLNGLSAFAAPPRPPFPPVKIGSIILSIQPILSSCHPVILSKSELRDKIRASFAPPKSPIAHDF